MDIQSPVFKSNKLIPSKYTCDGENVNPPLLISDVPENAKSLILIVDDPDASRGAFVHWTVWNIDPGIKGIKENSCPQNAVEGRTDFGKPGYGGPCPPSGTHRYFFKLFALNTTLDIDTSTEAADLEREIEDKILTKAQLVGLYRR
jgi:Raf kinase inhibitor-like YbhB/YbcL family protein